VWESSHLITASSRHFPCTSVHLCALCLSTNRSGLSCCKYFLFPLNFHMLLCSLILVLTLVALCCEYPPPLSFHTRPCIGICLPFLDNHHSQQLITSLYTVDAQKILARHGSTYL
jgi:hypothetical protein